MGVFSYFPAISKSDQFSNTFYEAIFQWSNPYVCYLSRHRGCMLYLESEEGLVSKVPAPFMKLLIHAHGYIDLLKFCISCDPQLILFHQTITINEAIFKFLKKLSIINIPI